MDAARRPNERVQNETANPSRRRLRRLVRNVAGYQTKRNVTGFQTKRNVSRFFGENVRMLNSW